MTSDLFVKKVLFLSPWLKIMLALSLLTLLPVSTQDAPPVITRDNVRQLQSVAHLDFDSLPDEAGQVENGWFAVSADGDSYTLLNRDSSLVFWNIKSGYLWTSTAACTPDVRPGSFVDGSFHPEDDTRFLSAYMLGNTSYVGFHDVQNRLVFQQCDLPDMPLRIWADRDRAWAEMFPQTASDKPYVIRFPLLDSLDSDPLGQVDRLPSAPENNPDSYLRIGRIDPPLAITVTREGQVKRWHLETGDVTAIAEAGDLPGMGAVSADGRYFAWRDGASAALHLLDFESGEDRLIAPLNGVYIPFMALTPGADVIFGVNVGLEPIVVAWDATTGERTDLGEYRACKRQPDMVRLSQDGTTLVIGCDTGLDIWRVSGEMGNIGWLKSFSLQRDFEI